jgi:stalled ribosome rescue protein Dom34
MNQTNELIEDYLSGPSTRKKKEIMDQNKEIKNMEIQMKNTEKDLQEIEKIIREVEEMSKNLNYGGRMSLNLERGELLDLNKFDYPKPSFWSRIVGTIGSFFGK